MKYFFLLSTAVLLVFASCNNRQDREPGTSTGRKIIVPEGYTQGLPFTPGILVDGTLYTAGLSGEDIHTGIPPEEFETEVKQTLDKIGVVLKAADMNYTDVVSVHVYLTDMKLFDRMNAVYRTYFPEPRPTRTIVGSAKFAGGLRIEITAIAKK
jgi:enamine deaminase RidA (YjgF/YER057c/UK114 family)